MKNVAFAILQKRGNVHSFISNDFKSNFVVNFNSSLLKLPLPKQIGFAIPHNLSTSCFSEIIKKTFLTIKNSTDSRTHPIVPFGIVAEHPWYLFCMVFLPSLEGQMNFALRKVVARMFDFVRVLDKAMVSLCIANTYDKNHVEMLFWSNQIS